MLTPSLCAFSLSAGVTMPCVWHFGFPMRFLLGKKYCSCEGEHTHHTQIYQGMKKKPTPMGDGWMEVEVWLMVMDVQCQSWEKKKRTHKFQVQITGDAMHSWRLLYDPVKDISQGRSVASSLSIGTDRGSANPCGKLQARQDKNSTPNYGWKKKLSVAKNNNTWI